MKTETNKKKPTEVSKEEAANIAHLSEIIRQDKENKIKLENESKYVRFLKKSKFYLNSKEELREHIASYKGYAILIKQEQISEELDDKETKLFPTLVRCSELKNFKKVNGNVVRKMQPKTLSDQNVLMLVHEVRALVDKGL